MRSVRLLARSVVVLSLLAVASPGTPAIAHGGADAGYRWVDGAGEAPLGRSAQLTVGVPTDLWTPDAQAVVSLPAGALAGAAGAAVPVTIEPAEVGDLGALPDGFTAAGNAYRVDARLARPGRIVLAGAHPVAGVLHSTDGERWEELPVEPAGDGRADAPLPAPGWYLAVTADDHGRPPVAWGLLAVAAAALLVGARRMRARPA